MNRRHCKFEELLGLTLDTISGATSGSERIKFLVSDGRLFLQEHLQDCCESVYVTQIDGDVEDLIGHPLLQAEVASSDDAPPHTEYTEESYTWTFFKLATTKGYVTIRWFGSSNGYYCETPAFYEKV